MHTNMLKVTGGRLTANRVVTLDYCTRDLTGHDDREEDTIEAFWTGEIDTWGKLTIRPVNGDPTLYLFPDEIIGVTRFDLR